MIDKDKLQFADGEAPDGAHPLGWQCAKCFSWMRLSPEAGICRRLPPQVIVLPGAPLGTSAWPITGEAAWCGEFGDAQMDWTGGEADEQRFPTIGSVREE